MPRASNLVNLRGVQKSTYSFSSLSIHVSIHCFSLIPQITLEINLEYLCTTEHTGAGAQLRFFFNLEYHPETNIPPPEKSEAGVCCNIF